MELEGWKVSYLYTDLCLFCSVGSRKIYICRGRGEQIKKRKKIYGQRKREQDGKETNIWTKKIFGPWRRKRTKKEKEENIGDFTRVKSPMNFHGGFYPSGNTLDYKMTHWLFTLFQIISNILTSSLLTFSVIYTFYFYIASEGLKIYQKYLIKKVPDFPFLEKFIRDNLNDYLRNSFLEGLSNFSLLLLLFDSSNLVSRATWRNELNQVIQTQAKILSLTENSSL